MELLTFALLSGFGYVYLIYPIVLRLLALRSPADDGSSAPVQTPQITVIVPVWNAAERVEQKIQNCLDLEYPPGALEILFVSDASTDATVSLVRRYPQVRLLIQGERGGKEACLRSAVKVASGEILCFTDVDAQMEASALRQLATHFTNPAIGAVSSCDMIVGDRLSPDRVHIEFEMLVRKLESRVSLSVGASGSCFACRASVARKFTHDQACSDLEVAFVCARAGLRTVHDEQFLVRYSRTQDVPAELSRQVRIITNGINTVSVNYDVLNPLRFGLFAWQVFSHKVARWLLSLLLLAWTLLGIGNLLLALDPRVLAGIAVGAVVVALGDLLLNRSRLLRVGVRNVALVAVYALAAVAALFNILMGRHQQIWAPTERQP